MPPLSCGSLQPMATAPCISKAARLPECSSGIQLSGRCRAVCQLLREFLRVGLCRPFAFVDLDIYQLVDRYARELVSVVPCAHKRPAGSACRQTPSCCAYRPADCQARHRQCAFRHDIPPQGRWSLCSRPERADSCGRCALAKRLHVCLSAGPAGCCRGPEDLAHAHAWAHVRARTMAQMQV